MIKTILVADGDEASCQRTAWCLRVQGYRVFTATTGVDALAAMAGDAVDLLVLDTGLTAVDAHAVIREMQKDTKLLKVCVLLTADRGSPVRDDHDLAVLHRPFTPARLVDMVRGMLGTPRARSLSLSSIPVPIEDVIAPSKDPSPDDVA